MAARLGHADEPGKTEEPRKPVSDRLLELIAQRIDELEEERQRLIKAQAELEEEAGGDLGSLDEELETLEALWPHYTFEKRRSLINFVVKEVILDTVSTHWMKVQVLWLHEAWGREEMYYWRDQGGSKRWTEEEIALMHKHYATMPKHQLMALLPERSWRSVLWYGRQVLGIPRTNPRKLAKEFDENTSHSDLEFMRNKGIPQYTRCTNWESLFR